MNHQENINKIVAQLEELWQYLPNTSPVEQEKRQELRTKIESLQQLELKELENLGNTYLADKTNWLSERTQLERVKKDAETALLAEKKKLSEELVTKLDSLGLPEEKLTELKTLLAELKDKKAEVKLSETDRKELAKELQPTNYWAIGAYVFAILACLIATGFGIFIKSKESK